MRNLLYVPLLLSLCLFTACDDDDDQRFVGSGNLSSEVRAIADFSDVDVSESIAVDIRRGSDFSVEVTADDNLIERIRTELRGGELSLFLAPGNYQDYTARVAITMPAIKRLSASTSSDMRVTGFRQTDADWTIDMSTSSSLTVLESEIRDLDVTMTTSSEANCFGLQTTAVNIDLSTSSDLEISVSDRLTGEANTSSEARYRGDPTVEVETNTSASVRRVQ